MLLKNCIIYNDGNQQLCDIAIENGIITDVGHIDMPGRDMGGRLVVPGLIDCHIHGAAGADVMDGDYDRINDFLLDNGVTSWLPTVIPAPIPDIRRLLSLPRPPQAVGFHMEGPYVSPLKCGALDCNFIKSPDADEFSTLPDVSMVTVAPETDGALDFIRRCPAVVCIGHTNADYSTAASAVSAGAKCLTHLYNCMPPLLHRQPGPIGAALEAALYAQLICDGIHVSRPAVLAAFAMFPGKIVLISDSIRAAGMRDGKYSLGGVGVTVCEGVARTDDGALAGSTATLLSCVKKAISFGISPEDAFAAASANPARLLNLKKGCIRIGYDADLLVLDGMQPLYVISAGVFYR